MRKITQQAAAQLKNDLRAVENDLRAKYCTAFRLVVIGLQDSYSICMQRYTVLRFGDCGTSR